LEDVAGNVVNVPGARDLLDDRPEQRVALVEVEPALAGPGLDPVLGSAHEGEHVLEAADGQPLTPGPHGRPDLGLGVAESRDATRVGHQVPEPDGLTEGPDVEVEILAHLVLHA